MEPADDIIVFKQFENAIEANIVKTKLDAYGVPCFLTEENLANLYPGQHFNVFNIRLHLFAKDKERAMQIADESNLMLDDEQIATCPQCRSNKLEHYFPKKLTSKLSSWASFLFLGIFFSKQKVYRCQECACEFDTP